MTWQVLTGDCVERMSEIDEASVDAIVTDPPYGLEFMGKEWDRLNTYAGGNPAMKPQGEAIDDEWNGMNSQVKPGYRKKNPRCRRCGKLKRGNGACKCPSPDWSYRHDESGFQVQSWHQAWATEALRVLKPGGHLLAFGGSRTYHRLACAVEDAGFEIRDSVIWLYGSGFPKSLAVDKAIDRQRKDNPDWKRVGAWLREKREAAGLQQKEVAAHWPSVTGGLTGCVANWEGGFNCPTLEQWGDLKCIIGLADDMDAEVWRLNGRKGQPGENWEKREKIGKGTSGETAIWAEGGMGDFDITAPATPEAAQWEGWGTALKPAHEPIVLARKPLVGTVASNCLEWGTGALNIDATRIRADASSTPAYRGGDSSGDSTPSRESSLSLHTLRTLLAAASAELPDPHSRLVASDLAHAVGHRPVPDSQDDCLICSRCGDALVRLGEEVAQEAAPSPLDAHSVLSRQWLVERIRELQCDDHPSTWDVLARIAASDTGYSNGRTGEASAGKRYAEEGSTNFAPIPGPRGGDSLGRWPANVALSHLPECEQVGTRRVKGSRIDKPYEGEARLGYQGGAPGRPARGIGDEDGTETIPAYQCAPGCPVAALDEQSGEARSSGTYERQIVGAMDGAASIPISGGLTQYEDRGGASRFFYTAKASRAERNAGLDGFEERWSPTMGDGIDAVEHSRPCTCDTFTPSVNVDQSQSTRADSDTPPPRDTTAPSLGDDSDTSTIGSGSRSTDQSQRDSMSTTSMGTSRTTESKTSNSSTPLSTSERTRPTTENGMEDGSGDVQSVESGNQPPLSTTTLTETDGSNTDDAVPAISESSSHTSKPSKQSNCCPDCGGVIDGGRVASKRNVHPLSTVKPIDLMRWLVRLVTPPDGLILDPFVGSGTTGCAAVLESFEFIGIEREPEYVEIAKARIEWWERHQGREADEVLAESRRSETIREQHEAAGQIGLFAIEESRPVSKIRLTDPTEEREDTGFRQKPGRIRNYGD